LFLWIDYELGGIIYIMNLEQNTNVPVPGKKIITNESAKVVPVSVVNEKDEQVKAAKKVEEENRQIEIVKQGILKEFGDINNESIPKIIEPLEYFKGDEVAMKEHFSRLEQQFANALPVENSIVRIEQQNEILEQLEAGNIVVIEAYMRQGKTSMLKSLGNAWDKKYNQQALFIDSSMMADVCEKPREDFNKEFALFKISSYIRNNFEDISRAEIMEDLKDKDPLVYLDELLGKRGKNILLEVDEFTTLLEKNNNNAKEFMDKIKNFKNIKTIIAWHAFDIYADKANDSFKDCIRTPIKPLTIDDTKLFIEDHLKKIGSDVNFSDDAIKRIYDYTGGRPMDTGFFLAQLTGGSHLEAVKRMKYEKTDIDDFIIKNHLELSWKANQAFKATVKNIPDIYNSVLNEKHKNTLTEVVNMGGEVPLSNIEELNANELINLGLIAKNENNNTYKINGELVFNLLKEQIEYSTK
jgi:hypothetical protein